MLQKSTKFTPEQKLQEGVVKLVVDMMNCTLKSSQYKWVVRYEKWGSPKVCWKFKNAL